MMQMHYQFFVGMPHCPPWCFEHSWLTACGLQSPLVTSWNPAYHTQPGNACPLPYLKEQKIITISKIHECDSLEATNSFFFKIQCSWNQCDSMHTPKTLTMYNVTLKIYLCKKPELCPLRTECLNKKC